MNTSTDTRYNYDPVFQFQVKYKTWPLLKLWIELQIKNGVQETREYNRMRNLEDMRSIGISPANRLRYFEAVMSTVPPGFERETFIRFGSIYSRIISKRYGGEAYCSVLDQKTGEWYPPLSPF